MKNSICIRVIQRDQIKVIQCIVSVAIIIQLSCNQGPNIPPEVFVSNHLEINKEVKEILHGQINEFQIDSLWILRSDTLSTAQWIAAYFLKNQYIPIWTDNNQLNAYGDSLLSMLSSLRLYGIEPEWYNVDSIKSALDKIPNTNGANFNVTRIYEINIMLTDLFFRIASNLRNGLINELTLKKEWKINRTDTSLIFLLESAIKNGKIRGSLESVEPKMEQYSLLKKSLNQYLQVEAGTGYSEKEIYFKDSIKSCIIKLMINMERCRWESNNAVDYLVVINIPSNEMVYYSCRELTLKSRIITGKKETPTPFNLNSEIKYFYVYPYWTIPFSIATKEILPKLKKDSNYLVRNNMDVLDKKGKIINAGSLSWNNYSNNYFPFTIRQRDGDENTLGVLKFIFPNSYGIYLHDTNSKELFDDDDRNLSHGCIRLEKAIELAEEISKCCAINFNNDTLARYIQAKTRKLFTLYKPLPIYIRYYTVKADSNDIYFYKDVYSLDDKIFQTLYK